MRRRGQVAWIATLLIGNASSASTQVSNVSDSAGILIVMNRAPVKSANEIRIHPAPIVEIGNRAGEGGEDFAIILSARFLADGDIAVSDFQAREVRIFDGRSGILRRTVGRAGEGPGEFSAAPTIAPVADGGFWTWDPGNHRLSLFSATAALRDEVVLTAAQLSGVPFSFGLNSWFLSPTGDLLGLAPNTVRVGGQFGTMQRITLMHGEAVNSARRIGHEYREMHATDGSMHLPNPFRSNMFAVVAGQRIYVTGVDGWQVNVYAFSGEVKQIIRANIPRAGISPALRRNERRLFETNLAHEPAFLRLFDTMSFGDSASAISRIGPVTDHSLWVLRWNSRLPDDDQVFDVIALDGKWLYTVTVPAEMGELVDVRADSLLTVWSDEYDVPYLRVYRFSGG